jgi:hypothetical protein
MDGPEGDIREKLGGELFNVVNNVPLVHGL